MLRNSGDEFPKGLMEIGGGGGRLSELHASSCRFTKFEHRNLPFKISMLVEQANTVLGRC